MEQTQHDLGVKDHDMDDATQLLMKQMIDGQTRLHDLTTSGFREIGERVARVEATMEAGKDVKAEIKADILDVQSRVSTLETFKSRIAGEIAVVSVAASCLLTLAVEWLKSHFFPARA
jgi:hypothetical protein